MFSEAYRDSFTIRSESKLSDFLQQTKAKLIFTVGKEFNKEQW